MNAEFINAQLACRGIPLSVFSAKSRRTFWLNEIERVTVHGITVDALPFSEFLLTVAPGQEDALYLIEKYLEPHTLKEKSK